MRTLDLARIAAEAELLHRKQQVRRLAFRAVYGAIALVFLLAALGWGHWASFVALNLVLSAWLSALIVVGVDVLLAVIFGIMAATGGPGRIEREALQLRKEAELQLTETMARTAIMRPALRLLAPKHILGLAIAGITARAMRR
ncbi:MAG: hypothetical protein JOY71_15180 [Acetobacteraceae bacterium]|nr:hypothetical protein [Acetobacteraceae bacterium]MBV8523442.1 hypothetical protein [Acetobacteraceae bacterium]MBV8590025.1 hypothetical protein [Acetobacteraceae bacterium]